MARVTKEGDYLSKNHKLETNYGLMNADQRNFL